MISIPPGLTETQARVYESYALWYRYYRPVSPFLTGEKEARLKRHLEVATAFNNSLRRDIGLPDA